MIGNEKNQNKNKRDWGEKDFEESLLRALNVITPYVLSIKLLFKSSLRLLAKTVGGGDKVSQAGHPSFSPNKVAYSLLYYFT